MGEQFAEDPAVSHWTSWPPMDDGLTLTDDEQMALVTAVRVQQVAWIIARDTGASEDNSLTAAWSLASVALLATPWRGEHHILPGQDPTPPPAQRDPAGLTDGGA